MFRDPLLSLVRLSYKGLSGFGILNPISPNVEKLKSVEKRMAMDIFAITQDRRELEGCGFHQFTGVTTSCSFLRYCIRRDHFKNNHICETLQKCMKTVCHFEKIFVLAYDLDRATSDLQFKI